MTPPGTPRHAAEPEPSDELDDFDDYDTAERRDSRDRRDAYDSRDGDDSRGRERRDRRTGPGGRTTGTGQRERGTAAAGLLWFVWVIGLALLWYGVGFASTLAAENLPGAPEGSTLALPLYVVGYGRLVVGALVAGTVVGLVGRWANRIWPAGLLAAGVAWAMTRSGLEAYSQDQLYGDDRILLLGTILLAVATVVGLGIGLAGAGGVRQRLVALSLIVGIGVSHVVGIVADLQSAFTGEAATSSGSDITRWLTLAALFGLAVAIAALGRAPWLLLTAIASVVLPVIVTVLGYLSQLIRPGAGRDIDEQILAPIADLLSAVMSTWSTWWPPLAVLAGGVVGLVVWQARRSRPADMPVLDPVHPVTTGDPGGRTPRRGDPDD